MCQMEVKSGGNTTNLRNHLKRRHNETFNEREDTKKQKMDRENVNLNLIQCIIEMCIYSFSMFYKYKYIN